MPRRNLNVEGKIGGKCKIRKRGCSSSSSPSLVQNYWLNPAILIGKRGGLSMPVPTWKMTTRLPSLRNDKGADKVKEGSMSARKLAATLWEINEVPTHNMKDNLKGGQNKGSVALHLTDLYHSPVSENKERHRTRKSLGGLDSSLQNANLIKVTKEQRKEQFLYVGLTTFVIYTAFVSSTPHGLLLSAC